MERRGQSAVEYLATYGWAFLIMFIVIAFLVGSGFFNPSRFANEECTFQPNLPCTQYYVAPSSKGQMPLWFNVTNSMGFPIYIDDAWATFEGVETKCPSGTCSSFLNQGDYAIISFPVTVPYDINPTDFVKLNMRLTFRNCKGLDAVSCGATPTCTSNQNWCDGSTLNYCNSGSWSSKPCGVLGCNGKTGTDAACNGQSPPPVSSSSVTVYTTAGRIYTVARGVPAGTTLCTNANNFCSSSGTSQTAIPINDTLNLCINGNMAQRLCPTGQACTGSGATAQCSGIGTCTLGDQKCLTSTTFGQCNNLGQYETRPCPPPSTCTQPTPKTILCVGGTCSGTEQHCLDNINYETCNSGAWDYAYCSSGFTCRQDTADTIACMGTECAYGDKGCSDAYNIMPCFDGKWQAPGQPCSLLDSSKPYCQTFPTPLRRNAQCVASPSCTPDDMRCATGVGMENKFEVCDANGKWSGDMRQCTNAGEVCVQTGKTTVECQLPPPCKLRTTKCINDRDFETCILASDNTPQWGSPASCASGVCDKTTNQCAPSATCNNGDKKCNGDILQTCVNNLWTSEDCIPQNKVCDSTTAPAQCAYCRKGDTRCSPTDFFSVETCYEDSGKNRLWGPDVKCTSGKCIYPGETKCTDDSNTPTCFVGMTMCGNVGGDASTLRQVFSCGPDGKWRTTPDQDCELLNQICDAGHCSTSATNGCPPDGMKCCTTINADCEAKSTGLYQFACRKGAWVPLQYCSGDNYCNSGDQQSAVCQKRI